MDPMSLEDLGLLDVLNRIDEGHELGQRSDALRERLLEVGLVDLQEGALRLTQAGVERCKSLKHRDIADAEAARVLREREDAESESAST